MPSTKSSAHWSRHKLGAGLLLLLALASCNAFSSIVHDDEVVAKVGNHRLYLSELAAYIPDYISSEDSLRLSRQYINSWATEILYANMAARHLSEAEMDVREELENYRRSLLKFRYEQHYIADRLDTLVTPAQIAEYYEAHKELFVLERPIVKARFLDIMKKERDRDKLISYMAGQEEAELAALAEMAGKDALKYVDYSAEWTDIVVLAKEFDMDYEELLSKLSKDYIKLERRDKGDMKVAYICDIRRSGVAPVEFCRERIKDILLSSRKHKLLSGLEQDLLTDAMNRNEFVIY